MDTQTNKLFLHYTVHSINTNYAIKTRTQSTQSKKRGKTLDKFNLKHKFYIDNSVSKITLKLSICLGFAKLNSQTNTLLALHTLHCTVYIAEYVPSMKELSKTETSQGRGPL